MPRLRLSFVSAFNERVQPLMDGSIQPEGVELIPTYSDPSETFWRQLKFQEFEVSEMSLSSYLIARSRGMDFIAIPVFPSRVTLLPLVLLIAVAAGLLVSFGLSQAFPTVHDLRSLRDTAQRPVLGTISMLADAAMRSRERVATIMFAVAFGGLLLFYGAWLTWMSVNPHA